MNLEPSASKNQACWTRVLGQGQTWQTWDPKEKSIHLSRARLCGKVAVGAARKETAHGQKRLVPSALIATDRLKNFAGSQPPSPPAPVWIQDTLTSCPAAGTQSRQTTHLQVVKADIFEPDAPRLHNGWRTGRGHGP